MNTSQKSASEVELADIRIIEQVFPPSFKPVVSHLQDIAVIRIFENHGRLLLHNEAGKPGFLNLDDSLKNRFDPFG